MPTQEYRYSIVIAVHDNGETINGKLPLFLSQEYEYGYEVIVVDEASTDNSEDALKILKQQHPHLYTTFTPQDSHYADINKLAFTIGIKAAKAPRVIIADIDHPPLDNTWLQTLAEAEKQTPSQLTTVAVNRKKQTMRIKTYDDWEQAATLLLNAERRTGRDLEHLPVRQLRGYYDFIVLRRDIAHDAMKMFGQRIGYAKHLWYTLTAACHK